MITGATSCIPNIPQGFVQTYGLTDDVVVSSSIDSSSVSNSTHSSSLLYNLSILNDKVHQVHPLVISLSISPDHQQQTQPTGTESTPLATMETIIQEIIVTASNMMFTCQQMSLLNATSGTNTTTLDMQNQCYVDHGGEQGFYSGDTSLEWYDNKYFNNTCNTINGVEQLTELASRREKNDPNIAFDIVELDAADLLAKYTHYCQVCGKGFKRDANLRMHMRAHGDKYKSNAALSNPAKNKGNGTDENGNGSENTDGIGKVVLPRKYSCPQEGCRWNLRHAKFQPLKSKICAKNHYRRSHCPKVYVCKRCNQKQFSVLSDLRTHEKHCGDLKWLCSCGNTFSRKDKLMGHVALFVGHTPAANCLIKMGQMDQHAVQMELEDR